MSAHEPYHYDFLGAMRAQAAALGDKEAKRRAARKTIPRNADGLDLRVGPKDISKWGEKGTDWFPKQKALFAKVPLSPDVFFVAVDKPNYVDWEAVPLVVNPDKPVVKAYLHFSSPDEFWAKADLVGRTTPVCAGEMIPEGTPVRGFFDLEVDPAQAWDGDELKMCQSVLDLLNEVAGPLGHPLVTLADCTVSCASVPEKRSCHLVVLNAWWPCISDLRRVVAVMLERAGHLRYSRPKDGAEPVTYCLLDKTTSHKQVYRMAGSYKAKHDTVSDLVVATRRLEPVCLPGMAPLSTRCRDDYLASGMGRDWLDAHHCMNLDTDVARDTLPKPMRGGSSRALLGMTLAATTELEGRIMQVCKERNWSVPFVPGTCNEDGYWQGTRMLVCPIAGRQHRGNRSRCRTTGAVAELGCYNVECREKGWQFLLTLVQFAGLKDEEAESDEAESPAAAAHSEASSSDSESEAVVVTSPPRLPSYESATEDPAVSAKKADLAARKQQRAEEAAALRAKRKAERAEERKMEREIKKAEQERAAREAVSTTRLAPVQQQIAEFKQLFVDAPDAHTLLEFPFERLHAWELRNEPIQSEEERRKKGPDASPLRKARARLVELLLPVLDSYWKLVVPSTGSNFVIVKRPETLLPLRKRDPSVQVQDWVYRGQKAFLEEVAGHMMFLGVGLAQAWLERPLLKRWQGADWHPPHASRDLPATWLDLWPGLQFAHEQVDRLGDASAWSHGAFYERFVIEGLARTENEGSAAVKEIEHLQTCFPKPAGWEERLEWLRLRHPGQFLWDSLSLQYTFPGKNPRTAMVLTGEGGTGKSTVMKTQCKLYGDRLWTKADLNEITGLYNGGLKHKLLVFAEEITVTNNKDAETFKRLVDSDVIRIRLMKKDFTTSLWCGWIVILNNSVDAPFHVSGSGGNRKVVPFKIMHGLLEKGGWNEWGGAECGKWMDEKMDLYSVAARMLKRGRELGPDHDLTSRLPVTLGMQEQQRRAVASEPAVAFLRDVLQQWTSVPNLTWGEYYPMPLFHDHFLAYWNRDDKVVKRFQHVRTLTEELDRVLGAADVKDVRRTTLEKGGFTADMWVSSGCAGKLRVKCRLMPQEAELRTVLKLTASEAPRDEDDEQEVGLGGKEEAVVA